MKPMSDLGEGIQANLECTGENFEPLPVFDDGQVCLTRWRLSFKERLQVLFGGSIWVCIGGVQPPMSIRTNKKDVFEI
jgi:hypothetical protein